MGKDLNDFLASEGQWGSDQAGYLPLFIAGAMCFHNARVHKLRIR